MRGSSSAWKRPGGGGGGVNPGPIWPCLASFTPTTEAENEATVASFGPPLTRMRWASRPWLWPWLASLRVARSGKTFNSVSFRLISSHSYRLRGAGMRGSRLHGNDVYGQCSNQRGYGVRGGCRWLRAGAQGSGAGGMRGSRLRRNDGTCVVRLTRGGSLRRLRSVGMVLEGVQAYRARMAPMHV